MLKFQRGTRSITKGVLDHFSHFFKGMVHTNTMLGPVYIIDPGDYKMQHQKQIDFSLLLRYGCTFTPYK